MATDHSELLAIAKAEVDRLYAEVGEAIRRLEELRAARRNARDTLGIIISEAVRDGMTWAQIGQAMGVTGQAAGQMYRRMR
jgi:hypothetical protein